MNDELRSLAPQAPLLPRFPAETRVSVVQTELFGMGYAHGYRIDPLMFISTQYIRGWVSGYLDQRYTVEDVGGSWSGLTVVAATLKLPMAALAPVNNWNTDVLRRLAPYRWLGALLSINFPVPINNMQIIDE